MPSNPLLSVHGEHTKVPIWLRASWRYFITGRALTGPGDNATLFHHATVDYRARPYIRLTRRKWERLARRNAAITVPALGILASPTPWVDLWMPAAWEGGVAAAGVAYGVVATRRALSGRTRNRRYIDPAARTLYSMTGQRYDRARARRSIELPAGWKPGDSVRVVMPNDHPLTPAKEKQLVRAIGGRLGIVHAKGSWIRAGERVQVEIHGTPLPPEVITMDMLDAAIAAAPVSQPVVGYGPDGPVSIDLEQDSPHVALSGAAGTGKTTLLRFLLAQRMAHGVGVIFLDTKRWSHRWAHKLPEDRAQYWYRIADIHEALVAIGAELERRINCDESELGTFRELDVVLEEINSLSKMLGAYWRGERRRIMNAAKAAQRDGLDYDEADLDPPTLSPAVAAMQFAVNMGRELQIHVWVAAQRLEANVFGSNSGGAVRQSFALRFMAQWDMALWKMLASGQEYVAWPGGKRGLWGFVQGQDFTIVRVPALDMHEALAMATGGQVPTGPVLGRQRVHPSVAKDVDTDGRPLAKAGADRELASGRPLSALLDTLPGQDGPDALSLDGLRTAVKRAGHPGLVAKRGQTYLYDEDALASWRSHMLGVQ